MGTTTRHSAEARGRAAEGGWALEPRGQEGERDRTQGHGAFRAGGARPPREVMVALVDAHRAAHRVEPTCAELPRPFDVLRAQDVPGRSVASDSPEYAAIIGLYKAAVIHVRGPWLTLKERRISIGAMAINVCVSLESFSMRGPPVPSGATPSGARRWHDIASARRCAALRSGQDHRIGKCRRVRVLHAIAGAPGSMPAMEWGRHRRLPHLLQVALPQTEIHRLEAIVAAPLRLRQAAAALRIKALLPARPNLRQLAWHGVLADVLHAYSSSLVRSTLHQRPVKTRWCELSDAYAVSSRAGRQRVLGVATTPKRHGGESVRLALRSASLASREGSAFRQARLSEG